MFNSGFKKSDQVQGQGVPLTRQSFPRGGNPGVFELDSRLRGSDDHFLTTKSCYRIYY